MTGTIARHCRVARPVVFLHITHIHIVSRIGEGDLKGIWIAVFLLTLAPLSAAATPLCGGEPGWASVEITDTLSRSDHGLYDAGARTFALDPFEFGWRIGMLAPGGLEVPVFAAPLRPVETSPLNITGWHFRNRENTGPNMGEVNAPQHERRFAFGTLAADPEKNPGLVAPGIPGEGFGGLGVLTITDYTLTPPELGQRAAFTSLSFSVCLIWQGGGDRLDPIVSADPGVAFEAVVATMRGCGLDMSVFKLSDRMSKGREGAQRPYLKPDMDGDNIPDLVVPALRRADAAPGLAICLIGTETLVMAGYDGLIGKHLDPEYFGRADGWSVHKGQIYPSPEEGVPPVLTGDVIVLGKEDSSSVIVYLKPDLTVSSYWQGD